MAQQVTKVLAELSKASRCSQILAGLSKAHQGRTGPSRAWSGLSALRWAWQVASKASQSLAEGHHGLAVFSNA
eukprot:1133604-Pyramimonas_sp.AAC.1